MSLDEDGWEFPLEMFFLDAGVIQAPEVKALSKYFVSWVILVVGGQLDQLILEVFSIFNDSMILCYSFQFG